MNTEKIIFIGGSGRSGTTLMAQLLDLHSEIASIFEVHTFVYLLNHLREHAQPKIDVLERKCQELEYELLPSNEFNWRMLKEEVVYGWRKKIIEPLQSGESFRLCIKNWLDYMHRLQMIRDGSQYIAHKTPILVRYLPEIRQMYPESFFIHMIRDPRNVIASYLNQTWGPNDIDEGIKWYSERVAEGFKNAADFPNYLEVKLEDLLTIPVETFSLVQNIIEIRGETNQILNSGLIDFNRLNHRKNEFSIEVSNRILEKVKEDVPKIAELYL